jgi:hypothetical protein
MATDRTIERRSYSLHAFIHSGSTRAQDSHGDFEDS